MNSFLNGKEMEKRSRRYNRKYFIMIKNLVINDCVELKNTSFETNCHVGVLSPSPFEMGWGEVIKKERKHEKHFVDYIHNNNSGYKNLRTGNDHL